MRKSILKLKNFKSNKVLAVTALFSAISIICGKFLAFNIGDTLRFSFENLPIIIIGAFFGPVMGSLCGIVADLIGCLLRGYAINPILTIASAYIGFGSGLFFNLFRKTNLHFNCFITLLLCHSVGSVLIKSIGLSIWYGLPFEATLLQRTLNYIIVLFAEYIIMIILLKNKTFTNQLNRISGYENDV